MVQFSMCLERMRKITKEHESVLLCPGTDSTRMHLYYNVLFYILPYYFLLFSGPLYIRLYIRAPSENLVDHSSNPLRFQEYAINKVGRPDLVFISATMAQHETK
jgi:hypothetical protein